MQREVLEAPIGVSSRLTPSCAKMIKQLLEREVDFRIGFQDLQEHDFFAGLNWKRIEPVLKPAAVRGDFDTRNFCSSFTKLPTGASYARPVPSVINREFNGFTYDPRQDT